MARVKKTEAAPPPPKHWREIKHGCCSCRFYRDDPKDKSSPCYPCTDWNYWEDADPDQAKPFPTVSPKVSEPLTDTPEQTEAVLKQDTLVSKPATRRTRKTAVVPKESDLSSNAPVATATKRPGRPKKPNVVQEEPVSNFDTPAAEPKKRGGRPKKNADEPQNQAALVGTDQLSLDL